VRIEILPEAQEDLIAGFRFYEHQAPGLGSYFRESILTDVDAFGCRRRRSRQSFWISSRTE